MTTDQFNVVISVCAPLLLAWLISVSVPAWQWLVAHIDQIKDSRLRAVCLDVAQAIKHSLADGSLLSAQHEGAALAAVQVVLPRVPTARLTTAVQAAFHVVNEASKAVVAQQTAAATTSAPVTPAIDYGALAGTLLQAFVPAKVDPKGLAADIVAAMASPALNPPDPLPAATPPAVETPAIVLPATP